MFVTSSKNGFSVKAYRGDGKTLLAFNMPSATANDLAGFTICCTPKGRPAYYLFNALTFANSAAHFQDPKEPAYSSLNAPFQKFQWLHVPGQFHQGEDVFYGPYDYTVTPRHFNAGKLQQLDSQLSIVVTIDVSPFSKEYVELGFTRGFVQSQAFVHHFGYNAAISPEGGKNAFFNTGDVAATVGAKTFTFKDEYMWSGYTARKKIFDILDEVTKDKNLSLAIFAYDLYEPDFSFQVFALAKEGRVRIILDNAALHHDGSGNLAEDQFETEFRKVAKEGADIKRGKFNRFSHNKIMVVMKGQSADKVLTGSTNFSVTGMYVNSNHVIIFNDPKMAQAYADVFNESWNDNVSETFAQSQFANKTFSFSSPKTLKVEISYSPHQAAYATEELQKMADRVLAEKKSVLFAVMDVSDGSGPLLSALKKLHASNKVFSFGISDTPKNDLTLYKPGVTTGLLVSGKISGTLPPPFDKEKSIGIGHQIHHKFIVCNFTGPDAVVYCGSSNLAEGGEEQNGDNLIAIYDTDIATVFAIEAIGLIDHFNFRNTFGNVNHPANVNVSIQSDHSSSIGKLNRNVDELQKNKMNATEKMGKVNVTNTTIHSSVQDAKTKDDNSGDVKPLRNKAQSTNTGTTSSLKPMNLSEDSTWTKSYYSEVDTHCQERSLLA